MKGYMIFNHKIKKMKKKFIWIYYDIRWRMNIFYRNRIHKNLFNLRKKYGKNRFILGEEANGKIKEMILSNKPFACCRFGISEFNYVIQHDKDEIWEKNSLANMDEVREMFQLFPNDKGSGISKFAGIMREACNNADFLGVWPYTVMGDYYVSTIEDIQKKVVASALLVEPYYYDEPWSEALRGKKVLVISPFDDEIMKQYKTNRDRLFLNKKVLPEFELVTLKAVWFDAAGKDPRFTTWFDVYDYLYEEAMKLDFDIALLGCGTFGFPLASRFKAAGKQAIHMGGALQLLFGIIGKRWEENENVNCFFNDFWIHPEKPKMELNYTHLDEGCYW